MNSGPCLNTKEASSSAKICLNSDICFHSSLFCFNLSWIELSNIQDLKKTIQVMERVAVMTTGLKKYFPADV